MESVKDPDALREQTFRRLVEQYQTALLRMCYIYLRDLSLAEDAVQDTFLKAYRAYDAFRGECGEKTWLMRIALNTCHDVWRSGWHRHMDRRVTPELLPEPQTAPDEAAGELVAEIMALPRKQQEVILLYYYQNMTVYEIAQALGIDHSSVSYRMKKAKEKLRSAMKGERFHE